VSDPIYLHETTSQAVPVTRVLDAARKCRSVLILGELEDGTFYRAASGADMAVLLLWMESFKFALLSGEYD
jgi:hypothetical protein